MTSPNLPLPLSLGRVNRPNPAGAYANSPGSLSLDNPINANGPRTGLQSRPRASPLRKQDLPVAEQQLSAPSRAPYRIPRPGVMHEKDRQPERYVKIGNHLAQHRELSLTAIGLSTYIQSLPTGADVSIKALAQRFTEGETRIASALRELEAHGYLSRTRERLPSGQIVTRTVSYNNPPARRLKAAERPVQPPATAPAPARTEVPDPDPEPEPGRTRTGPGGSGDRAPGPGVAGPAAAARSPAGAVRARHGEAGARRSRMAGARADPERRRHRPDPHLADDPDPLPCGAARPPPAGAGPAPAAGPTGGAPRTARPRDPSPPYLRRLRPRLPLPHPGHCRGCAPSADAA